MRDDKTQQKLQRVRRMASLALAERSLVAGKNGGIIISKEKVMGGRKIIRLAGLAMAATMAVAGTFAASNNTYAKYVLATPPSYKANERTNFTVSKIIPSESYMEATFELLPDRDWTTMYRLNIGYGVDPSDYILNQSSNSAIPGATTIHNQTATRLGTWASGVPMELTRLFNGTIENPSGRMYYIAVYSNGKRDFGRVDYSRCINSSVFKSGEATECRAEVISDTKIQYQPYTADGVRVEIPEEEDAILTALTERFVYESGDWPAEMVWVDDEDPENNNGGGSDDNTGENTGDNTGENTGENGNNSENNGNTEGGNTGEGGPDSGSNDMGNDDGDGSNSASSDQNNATNTEGGTNSTENGIDNANNTSEATSDNSASDSTSITLASADTTSSASSADNTNNVRTAASDFTDSTSGSTGVLGTDEVTIEIQIVDGENTGENSENTSDAAEIAALTGESDNVGVPELGKEFGNKNWWVAPVLMLLAAAAAIATWWFLFFGKRKSNKRKEEERVE